MKLAFPKTQALFEKDAQNISEGLYPLSVHADENIFKHYARIPVLLKDFLRANAQRRHKQAHVFSEEEKSFIDEAPEYYQRNFHFQDGGYFSDNSARLYDHQVEILFAGTAQAMRRQTLPVLKKHFGNSTGKGLKFLEIASGTGSLTQALALAFPEAQIVALDPSPHYLKFAKNRWGNLKRVSFIQGYGENLDFKNETFDAVISCFLFHELPAAVREQVLQEKHRVLKAGGLAVFADSIQRGDDPDLQWALDRFPVDFHEPFYKSYVENPMETLFEKTFGGLQTKDIHFLTKVLSAVKKIKEAS
jgi:ubiquinone/menaquinone biosynthesis C-methylase UbiE